MFYSLCSLRQVFPSCLCSLVGALSSTPIRAWLLHHQMEGITQNRFALISMYLVIGEFFKVTAWQLNSPRGQRLSLKVCTLCGLIVVSPPLCPASIKWNTSWTSTTRTPSFTASRTPSAAQTTSQTRRTRRTSCRRVCHCCLSWAPMLCSRWFYASGQYVEPLFNYYAWKPVVYTAWLS